MKHYLVCEAPICSGDANDNYKKEAIWYAGEYVCLKVPYQKFQKKQIDINKWVKKDKFKNIDIPYTAHDLEHRSI